MQTKKMNVAVLRLQKGDQTGFDFIYEQTHKLLYSVAFAYMKEYALAKDIVQETYLQFLKNLNQYNSAYSLHNYLITIAKNLSLNLLKKRGHETSEDFVDKEWQYQGLIEEIEYDFDTPIMNLAKQHLNQEELQILLMIAVSGYKRREIAVILQQTLPTITWRYQKIIKKMQELIKKEGLQ